MCICVNCIHVQKCTAYNLIRRQHGINYKTYGTAFTPVSTIIVVNIKSYNESLFDWDLQECLSFTEKPGHWINMNY